MKKLTLPNLIQIPKTKPGDRLTSPVTRTADQFEAAAERAVAVRDIVGDLPISERSMPGYFNAILLPAGYSCGNTLCAWYGLSRVGSDGGEIAYAGADVDMLSCDPNGVGITGQVPAFGAGGGGAEAKKWGTLQGSGAAMIVGINLPMTVGSWRNAPCDVPGITTGAGGNIAKTWSSAGGVNDYLLVESFPPGQFSSTGTGWLRAFRNILGSIRPIPKNSTLDIALVIGGEWIGDGTIEFDRYICGRGSIRPLIVRPYGATTFTR